MTSAPDRRVRGLLDTNTLILLPGLAARAFGQVAASLREAGRKTSARSYDAMIAAVAVANDRPLYTCNPDAFATIERLEVIDVT